MKKPLIFVLSLLFVGLGVFYFNCDDCFNRTEPIENESFEQETESEESLVGRIEESDRYFVIGELGIRFKTIEEIEDLVYTTFSFDGSDVIYVKLSSETLISADNNTGGDGCRDHGLGTISLYRDGDSLYKETGWYSRPQDRCSAVEKVRDLQYELIDILETSFDNSSESIDSLIKEDSYNDIDLNYYVPVDDKAILSKELLPESINLMDRENIIDFFTNGEDFIWQGPYSVSNYTLDDGLVIEAQSGVMFISFSYSTKIDQIEETLELIKDNNGILVGRNGDSTIQVFVNSDRGLEKLCNLVDSKEYSSCILNMTADFN